MRPETSQNIEDKTHSVKYTSSGWHWLQTPAAAERVIQMVPFKVDPMMPPKHTAIGGTSEGPVEILSLSCTARLGKITKEERDKWNVPACISSNWKNSRGCTPFPDKRLAAERGR
jgi:SNW domain-containing protein 1